jgi:ATP-dependent Clp protease adaptor protein ClpS
MAGPSTAPPIPETDGETRSKQLPPFNVVLLDDDEHSYDYVIRMMQSLFGHDQDRAYRVAQRVDSDGRVVCLTTHKEHAELKRDQILAFGKDPIMAISKGSMSAVIEPAREGEAE